LKTAEVATSPWVRIPPSPPSLRRSFSVGELDRDVDRLYLGLSNIFSGAATARQSPTQIMDDLTTIPGIGKSISEDLRNIGIMSVTDLKGKDPENLYDLSNKFVGAVQDPCLLYTFRCAVYFAETKNPDPALLKWWHWKGKQYHHK
jgi:hypothetical protein